MAAKVFLDTSALFSGIWSAKGGGRLLLKLGEVGAVQPWVSSQVLTEIDNALRRKAPELLGVITLLLERGRIKIALAGLPEQQTQCQILVPYTPDAKILAAAWRAQIDYFVTLDKAHFLENTALREAAPFLIGTPGDCISWYRENFSSASVD